MNSICYVPYVEVVGEDGRGTTLRRKLLDYYENRYNSSSFYRKAWSDFNIHTRKYTLQRFF